MTRRRWRGALVAVALLAAGLARPVAAQTDGPTVRRLAGATRLETAVAVSRASFDRARTVVLARADDPADALAGAPLAAHLAAPLLLVPTDGVPDVVRGELDRLGAEEVVLLGGEQALSPAVASEVGARTVTRVEGQDRVQTALRIARRVGPSPIAYVAGIAGPVDALAAGRGRRPSWAPRCCWSGPARSGSCRCWTSWA